ncbi:hypothetical protein QQF64_026188 [Cirrhinus molitorella]|uniref:Uncharacterized protein n=1 Tax=Cirrhinus molitorella TaxID=172907 RepID=A0ABR3NRK6_9TELE
MQPSEDVPVERPRRQTSLPAHLQDYDLSGYDLHRSLSPPGYSHKSPRALSPQDVGMDTLHVAAQRSDYHSPQQWYVADRWDQQVEALREENADLRKLQRDLITTVQQLKEERDDLKQANAKFSSQMSQMEANVKQLLSWQNQHSQPLQASSTPYVPYQSKVLDRPKPVPAPRKPRSIEPTANMNTARASPDVSQESSSAERMESSEYSSSQESLSSSVDGLRNMSLYASRQSKVKTGPTGRQSCQVKMVRSNVRSPSPHHSSRPQHNRSSRSKRRHYHSPSLTTDQERVYRGPTPTIPYLIHPNPREFARLKIALENILPADATEHFKFHILLEHLKLEEAQLIAESYSSSRHPYTNTMDSLNQQYGQPHQLALQRIVELMDGPSISTGDIKTFRMYALRVRSLVGMLRQLGKPGFVELSCGSHVSRLLSKLPHDLRSSFRRFIYPLDVKIPTLLNFADWLEYEIQVQEDSTSTFLTFQELLSATAECLKENGTNISALDFQQAEKVILQRAQWESFPAEMAQLTAGKQLNNNSRLLCLAPELDPAMQLLRIGGRLRHCEGLNLG